MDWRTVYGNFYLVCIFRTTFSFSIWIYFGYECSSWSITQIWIIGIYVELSKSHLHSSRLAAYWESLSSGPNTNKVTVSPSSAPLTVTSKFPSLQFTSPSGPVILQDSLW